MKRCSLRAAAALLIVVAIAGCGGADAPGNPEAPPQAMRSSPESRIGQGSGTSAPTFPSSLQGLEHTRRPLASALQAQADGGYTLDTTSREQVRLFHNTVFASSTGVAIGWNGNTATCTAGTTSADHKAAMLRRINWFRAMAGVPAAVQFDATFNAKAQEAALLMAANNQISHVPPVNSLCYGAAAVEAAGKSNLALGSTGLDSISGYMRDHGANNGPVGHRRWLLYPQTQFMGTGDVEAVVRSNALWVQDANLLAARPAVRDAFVAWPPPGYTPYATVYPRWSLSYPQADFSGAVVSMSENGVPIATRQELLVNGFGENTLVWFPGNYADGMTWAKPNADTVYQVTITNVQGAGVPASFSYQSIIFDPAVPGAGEGSLSILGSATLPAGQPGAYSFGAIAGATSYQWRSLATSAFAQNEGAESGSGSFTATTSAGYTLIASGVAATGANSFHLAHAQPVDQVLQLNQQLVAGAGATLHFSSRLGLSSPGQHALVEVSTDDGVTWTTVFDQAGVADGATTNFGETSFTAKSISLAAFADRTLRVRWRYALLATGSYYPQTDPGIGWYIDDIHATGVSAVTAGTPAEVAGPGFVLTASQGELLLQARAGMYGYFADWGPTRAVSVTAVNPADCLFNWAQAGYPTLFTPAASSQTFGEYYFRHYAATGIYLGISSADNNVYYLLPDSVPINAGPKANWFATAGCQ